MTPESPTTSAATDPTGSTSATSLIRMINQIARNNEHKPAAATAVAAHLRTFWSPSMIAEVRAIAVSRPDELSSLARQAVDALD